MTFEFFALGNLFHLAYLDFRRFCIESKSLPAELHIILSDIFQKARHVDDLFPYFLEHAKTVFPHLECMEDLKKISDLRLPANWSVNILLVCKVLIGL